MSIIICLNVPGEKGKNACLFEIDIKILNTELCDTLLIDLVRKVMFT